ncbi:hypothetical protein FQZ97_715940 [compost metagenome]
MFAGEQLTGEGLVVHRRLRPEVEAAVRTLHVQHRAEDIQHGVEFLTVQGAVGAHVDLVVPGGDAGQLGLHRHGAAVVGTVQQEGLEDRGVAGDEAGTQAWQVGALGQAVEDHAAFEVGAAEFRAGGEQAGGRVLLVEVELAVALVGGDHEVVFVGQGDQLLQGVQRDQRAGGVARRAEEEDLAALPDVRRHGVEVRVEAVLRQAGQVVRLGAGQQGRTFVDLIEGVGADHQAVVGTVDHGLGEGEQGFAGTVHRQHVAGGVEPAGRHLEAALAPLGDGLAQGRDAQGGGVHSELFEIGRQGLGDEGRGAVLGLADGQGDGLLLRRWLGAGQQGTEFLEGVGLQVVQGVVHV